MGYTILMKEEKSVGYTVFLHLNASSEKSVGYTVFLPGVGKTRNETGNL